MSSYRTTDEIRLKEYLKDRIDLDAEQIVRDDPKKRDLVWSAKPTLVELSAENLTSVEAVRDDPAAIKKALQTYFDIPEKELQSVQFRPCCSKFPGTYPLCNPEC